MLGKNGTKGGKFNQILRELYTRAQEKNNKDISVWITDTSSLLQNLD